MRFGTVFPSRFLKVTAAGCLYLVDQKRIEGFVCHFATSMTRAYDLHHIVGRYGKALRKSGISRWLALCSQSFLLLPSRRIITSGNKGNTVSLSG